ncbi:MAG: LPXTG cell wall anchor domain-containing protein [Mycobacteriales bacterium]
MTDAAARTRPATNDTFPVFAAVAGLAVFAIGALTGRRRRPARVGVEAGAS